MFKDSASKKYGIDILDHNSREVHAQVLPLSETEITCFGSSTQFLLVGSKEPDVKIYRIGEYEKPVKRISLNKEPSEIVIYEDSVGICVQASPSPKLKSVITFIHLIEGFRHQNQPGNYGKLYNVTCGSGFFLCNDDENRIRSWK